MARGTRMTLSTPGTPVSETPFAGTPSTSASRGLDLKAIRGQFPILAIRVHGRPVGVLENAATTQKPQVVLDRLNHYYARENANVHRGVHTLSERATDA